jgi:hypothetical protein
MALGKRERLSRSAGTKAGVRPSRLAARSQPSSWGGSTTRPDYAVIRQLQATAGNAATARLLELQRDSAAAVAAPPAMAPPQAAAPVAAQTSHDQAATDIVAIAGPLMTSPMSMKTYWSKIQAQVKKPVVKTKKGALQALYDGSMVTELKAVPSGERPALIAAVLDQLARAATAGLPSGPVSGATIQAEYNQLKKVVPIEGEEGGLVAMRQAVLASFGSIADAVSYYGQMTKVTFLGHTTRGHPDLAAALAKAENVLDKRKWKDVAAKSVNKVSALNLRENRNSPTQLSNHSFGTAVDISEDFNPNVASKKVGKQMWPLVTEITGENVFASKATAGANIASGNVDAVLAEAQRLSKVSQDWQAIFDDPTMGKLKTTMVTYAQAKGSAVTAESADQIIVDAKGNRSADLAKLLFPAPIAKGVKPKAVAGTIIHLYRIFKQAWIKDKKGTPVKKVESSAIGTEGSVAAHGFLNLAPEVVAACSGSEGGGLKWLGGVKTGTKDFMHFELPYLPPEIKK